MAQHADSPWLEIRGNSTQGMDVPASAEMTNADLFTSAASPRGSFRWQDLLAALPGVLSGASGGGGAFLQGFAQGQSMVDEQRSRQAVMAQQQAEREAMRVERRTEQEATHAREARREGVEAETRVQATRENATAFLQREAAALAEILDPEERQARLQFGAQLFQQTFPDRGDPSAYLAQLKTSGRHLRERAEHALTAAEKTHPQLVATPEWPDFWVQDFWGPGQPAKIRDLERLRAGTVLQPSGQRAARLEPEVTVDVESAAGQKIKRLVPERVLREGGVRVFREPKVEPTVVIQTVDDQGNPVTRIVRKTAGETFARPPTTEERNKQAAREKLVPSINALEQLGSRVITKVGPAQRATAMIRGTEAVLGQDPEFRVYQDARVSLAGNLAVAQQGSRPSDADILRVWLPLVPDVFRDTTESAKLKWQMIRQMMSLPSSSESDRASTSGTTRTGRRFTLRPG